MKNETLSVTSVGAMQYEIELLEANNEVSKPKSVTNFVLFNLLL